MELIVDALLRLKSQPVRLEFDDGEILDALLIDVDATEHQDLFFDVLSVHSSGGCHRYDLKNIYSAPISSVLGVQPID